VIGRSSVERGRAQVRALAADRRGAARRFLAFALVGLSGVPVTLVVSYALHAVLGLALAASTALAVGAAIGTNFIGNQVWTFRGMDASAPQRTRARRGRPRGPPVTWAPRPTLRRFAKFGAVSLVGLAVNTLVTTFVAAHYAAELRRIAGDTDFLLATLVGICAATLWNFLANVVWTWA